MAETERQPGRDAIARFWQWWGETRDPLTEAIGEFRSETFMPDLRERLTQLHPDLDFSLHPGLEAAHGLSITGATPESERIAHALLDSAPTKDDQWEYGNLVLPAADPTTLTCLVGDLEIRMTGMKAGVQHYPDTGSVVVEFFHPLLMGLDWDLVEQVLRHAADAVLGDSSKHTRIVVTRADHEPETALNLTELRMFLDGLD